MAQPNWYRKCVGCGKARHKSELLRIVNQKNNVPVIDFKQIKPGRGAYICPDKECAQLTEKINGLAKSFRYKITHSFYNQLTEAIKQIEQ